MSLSREEWLRERLIHAANSTAILYVLDAQQHAERCLNEEHGDGYAEGHSDEVKQMVDAAVQFAVGEIQGERLAEAFRDLSNDIRLQINDLGVHLGKAIRRTPSN